MSDSDTEDEIVIKSKAKKLTPLGYTIELSEAHAQILSEFVDSPAYHILKKHFVMQRRDQIARAALNGAQTPMELFYYKGMAAELVLLFKVLKKVKTTFIQEHTSPEDKNLKK